MAKNDLQECSLAVKCLTPSYKNSLRMSSRVILHTLMQSYGCWGQCIGVTPMRSCQFVNAQKNGHAS